MTEDSATAMDPSEPAPPPDPTAELVDRFMDSLTPAHHKTVAAPYASMEVNKAQLRQAALDLLEAMREYLFAQADAYAEKKLAAQQADTENQAVASPPPAPAEPEPPATPSA